MTTFSDLGKERRTSIALFASTAVASFLLYYWTLCPTVTWGDPAKLAIYARFLVLDPWGESHPLHNLIGHLWGLIPFQDYAYGQNLLSALFASLTVGTITAITFNIVPSVRAGDWLRIYVSQ